MVIELLSRLCLVTRLRSSIIGNTFDVLCLGLFPIIDHLLFVATLNLGSRPKQRELQGCGPKGSLGVKPKGSPGVKPRGCPGVKAKALQELRQEEARESHNILPGV
jgi:hypothetical protein